LVLSGKVLKCTCKEGLWEEESRKPVNFRGSFIDPSIQEVNSIVAINDPRTQRLERKETFLGPCWWYQVIKNAI